MASRQRSRWGILPVRVPNTETSSLENPDRARSAIAWAASKPSQKRLLTCNTEFPASLVIKYPVLGRVFRFRLLEKGTNAIPRRNLAKTNASRCEYIQGGPWPALGARCHFRLLSTPRGKFSACRHHQ